MWVQVPLPAPKKENRLPGGSLYFISKGHEAAFRKRRCVGVFSGRAAKDCRRAARSASNERFDRKGPLPEPVKVYLPPRGQHIFFLSGKA